MFKLFNKKIIEEFAVFIFAMLVFSGSNVLAVHSDKIEEAIKQIDADRTELRFEKDFLINYLKSDYDFGERFENKMYRSVLKMISYCSYNADCSYEFADQISRLDLSKCIAEYLEDKYIIGSDTADTERKEKISRILTLQQLESDQQLMYSELNNIISLVKDENAKKFVLANIDMNENIAHYILCGRLFTDYKSQVKKVLISMDPSRDPLYRITYNFLDKDGESVFDTSVSKKKLGAQFGGVLHIRPSKGMEEKCFFKTHQNGIDFIEFDDEIFFLKPVGIAQPVNIIELFIYELLEKLEMGPKVKFVVNPFVLDEIYIVTEDLGDKFNMASKISDEECLRLKDDREMICQLTRFDLFNRILGITDLHQDNYGVLYSVAQKLIKIVDFRAPDQPIPLSDITFESYFKAYGKIYHPSDKLVTHLLKNKRQDIKIQEGKEAVENLGLSIEQFREIVSEVKGNIRSFVNQIDNVSGLTIREQIGLDSYNISEELDIYENTIVKNFKFVKSYFEKI